MTLHGAIVVAVLCTGAVLAGGARAEEPGALSPGQQCAAAISAAQMREKIPDGRLAAIGRVESGRLDPGTRRWLPWPWTINVGGKGTFFDSADEAIAAVHALQAQGVRSIDVGCVQVNLMHHPDAFATLEQAFDPVTNAAYGGHFLVQLFTETRNWDRAVGYYHSMTPALAADYENKVLGIQDSALLAAASLPVPPPAPPSTAQQLASAWSATMGSGAASTGADFSMTVAPGRPERARPQAVEVAEAFERRVERPGIKARRAASP